MGVELLNPCSKSCPNMLKVFNQPDFKVFHHGHLALYYVAQYAPNITVSYKCFDFRNIFCYCRLLIRRNERIMAMGLLLIYGALGALY